MCPLYFGLPCCRVTRDSGTISYDDTSGYSGIYGALYSADLFDSEQSLSTGKGPTQQGPRTPAGADPRRTEIRKRFLNLQCEADLKTTRIRKHIYATSTNMQTELKAEEPTYAGMTKH